MEWSKLEKIAVSIFTAAIGATMIFFIVAQETKALVTYPASAGLGIGTVFSRHVKDGTLQPSDINLNANWNFGGFASATSSATSTLSVNASSTFAALWLNQSTNLNAGPLMEAISASTTRFIITRDGKIGFATSTPGLYFSVHGNALISGNLSIAGLTATGTASFGSGTSTTDGNFDAAGNIEANAFQVPAGGATSTFANGINLTGGCYIFNGQCLGGAADWVKLGETRATGGTTSIDVQFASSTYLKIYVYIPQRIESFIPQFRFNYDAGTNYDQRLIENAADGATTANGTSFAVTSSAGTIGLAGSFEIFSIGGWWKTGRWSGNQFDTAGGTNETQDGEITWRNSSATITSIRMFADARPAESKSRIKKYFLSMLII